MRSAPILHARRSLRGRLEIVSRRALLQWLWCALVLAVLGIIALWPFLKSMPQNRLFSRLEIGMTGGEVVRRAGRSPDVTVQLTDGGQVWWYLAPSESGRDARTPAVDEMRAYDGSGPVPCHYADVVVVLTGDARVEFVWLGGEGGKGSRVPYSRWWTKFSSPRVAKP